jgi:hypothetical protein
VLESVAHQPGTLYEYWLAVSEGETNATYAWSLICSLASQDVLGSVSEPDDDTAVRSIRLKREQTPRNMFGSYRGDSVRIRISITEAVGITRYIFGYKDRSFDIENAVEQRDFSFVTSPVDEGIYPIDVADTSQNPSFYRKDYLDVLVPSPRIADLLWQQVKTEVDNLIAAYNRRDELLQSASTTIE